MDELSLILAHIAPSPLSLYTVSLEHWCYRSVEMDISPLKMLLIEKDHGAGQDTKVSLSGRKRGSVNQLTIGDRTVKSTNEWDSIYVQNEVKDSTNWKASIARSNLIRPRYTSQLITLITTSTTNAGIGKPYNPNPIFGTSVNGKISIFES